MTPTFSGPAKVTRDGETYTEWGIYGGGETPYTSLRARDQHAYIIDEDTGQHLFVMVSDLGPLAAMLADAQQYLTGGQR